MKYTLNDVFIEPSVTSDIASRSECNPYYEDEMLPLFTAPMSSVIDENNYQTYIDNNINPILPRTVGLAIRLEKCTEVFCAFSLGEFEDNFIDNQHQFNNVDSNIKLNVLIDIANGHMTKLHKLIATSKKIFGDRIVIMAGNVANPETYTVLSNAGADYVRAGIGNGSVCITSSNTSIHYSMASLIDECYNESLLLNEPAKIIADGGMNNFSDIIKSLALGADYVMCGNIFAKMLESAAETYEMSSDGMVIVDQDDSKTEELFKAGLKLIKAHYGMSTKKAQKKLGKTKLNTSEGIEKIVDVEYTMETWVDNFKSYLKSAMSYCSARSLEYFIGYPTLNVVSDNSYNVINK